MELSDARIIQFLSESPLRSLAAMLDALRYLDGRWVREDLEYELFNDALGDNEDLKVKVRVPSIPGIAANALLAFTWHAKKMHMIRRRPRAMHDPFDDEPEDIVVFYELTPAGHKMVNILSAVEDARSSA